MGRYANMIHCNRIEQLQGAATAVAKLLMPCSRVLTVESLIRSRAEGDQQKAASGARQARPSINLKRQRDPMESEISNTATNDAAALAATNDVSVKPDRTEHDTVKARYKMLQLKYTDLAAVC